MNRARSQAAATKGPKEVAKESDLFETGLRVGRVRRGEMRVRAIQFEFRIRANGLRERKSLFGSSSHPPHPGIDLEVHSQGSTEFFGGFPSQGEPLPFVNDRGQRILARQMGLPPVSQAPQDEDLPADSSFAQNTGLVGGHHRQPLTAFALQAARDFRSAMPIAIGLDHGNHFPAPGEFPGEGEVGAERGEIDGCLTYPFHARFPLPRASGLRGHRNSGACSTPPVRLALQGPHPTFTPQVQTPTPMSADQSPVRQTVFVNGDSTLVVRGCTVDGLLETLGLTGRRVAVAVNRQVVARSRRGAMVLAADDRVEILEAVGGG